jgi:hypothetical protein
MNIFRLHDDPVICAQMHTNSHCVKMITEHAQLMSTAHHVAGSKLDLNTIYKRSHQNHPSAIWARESKSNYRWLHAMTTALCKEYTHRYGKVHKVESAGYLARLRTPPEIVDIGPTTQRLAMPEGVRCSNPVVAYRNYYVRHKSHLFVWRERDMPEWLVQFGFVQIDEEV